MNVADFDFNLPVEQIAQDARPRGTSRLMIVDRHAGTWRDGHIADLPSLLEPGDLLVVNDTRVFPARLIGRRVPTGGGVECFLLARHADGTWDALVSPGAKLQPGARAVFDAPDRAPGVALDAEILERGERGRRRVRFDARGVDGGDVHLAIDRVGHVPLPPYIRRADTPEDRERYQTVYARARGSVAAPTAGLHFDDATLAALAARGIGRAAVTLHVGYGTFKPVTATRVEDHVVDPEPYALSAPTVAAMAAARAAGRRVVAVGTTTTRALEHAARVGGGMPAAGEGIADLFIHPGPPAPHFAAIDGLVTNFHLPKSSLLMLVAAFAGYDLIMRAYRDAVQRGYRFYSFGDAMVIL